jgi:hypothetical protein
MGGFCPCFVWLPTLKLNRPLAVLTAYDIHLTGSRSHFRFSELSNPCHHALLLFQSLILATSRIVFAPQHGDVQCKNRLSDGRPLLRFLVASPRPRPRPRPLPLPPTPKATTVTVVTASFASTTYNKEVIFSPAIIARHNRAILSWLANEPHQVLALVIPYVRKAS